MSAVPQEIESLIASLGDDAPCGPDLEYDPEFQALEQAGAGTPERQYGDKIFPAEPPDWPTVLESAQNLATRTRDLRVAVWLTRARARTGGLLGAWRGLQLLQGLLETHWDWVHPQLDASDGNDPTMRLNALAPLAAGDALLADLRAAALASRRGSLSLRELELGLGRAEAYGDEIQPTEAGVLQALADLAAAEPALAEALQGCAAAASAIAALVDERAGSAAPDLAPFTRLTAVGPLALGRLQSNAEGADDGSTSGDADATADGAAAPGGGGGGGSLRNRSDAIRELERVVQWLERHEPSHPAPLLLRRAQRLLNMSFLEIIQDMAPGGLDQVQTIAGPQPDSSSYD
jgi:type VI secretion system protein ImpA